MAVRDGQFSKQDDVTLAEGTVRGTVGYVAATFKDYDRGNPTKDEDGDLGRLLQRQYRAYRNEDPNKKQQKALPIGVLRELAKLKCTESQRAILQLAIGGFFFAMRSCEYLKVSQAELRRTAILCIRNIRFLSDGKDLPLDHPLLELEYAGCVSITFEFQKKDERMDTVTQLFSGDDVLCPVRQWAAIVRRVLSYPGANLDTPVLAVWRNDKIEHISSVEMVQALRAAVVAVGEDKLGFDKEDIGTHSIRSDAAMAMFLGECPVYVIMMIGRWSSDAFLRYIRKQVEQFSHNVLRRMLRFETHSMYATSFPLSRGWTRDRGTTRTTQRRGGMLVAMRLAESCCRAFLSSTNQDSVCLEFIDGGSTMLPKGIAVRGESL